MLTQYVEMAGGQMPNLTARPRAIFNLIQSNLGDRYKSGFPVLKELIQNAEDAGATTIRFIAGLGWSEARNPLLRVPGLLVVNDGDFKQEDAESMLSFGLSEKAVNTESIGRFGYGQKAVFHLCDAFVVHSFGHPIEFTTVINPCLGVIPSSRADTWDTIGVDDTKLLEDLVHPLPSGLILWIPLRRDEILPAAKLSFRAARPTTTELVEELVQQQTDLGFVLAGLRNLDTIEVIEGGKMPLSLARTAVSTKMLGPKRAKEVQENRFQGTIEANTGLVLSYVGREMAPEVSLLTQLMESDDWPREPVPTADGLETQKKKAASHGAVVIGAWTGPDEAVSADRTVEWSVFLPVSHAAQLPPDARISKISLHGYFFVDSGRRYIEGFDPSDEKTLGSQWNVLLRDEVVLPLVPLVMHDALQTKALSADDLATLLKDMRVTEFGNTHLERLTSRAWLVRAPGSESPAGGIQWRLIAPGENLRSVPLPTETGIRWDDLNNRIFSGLSDWAHKRQLTLVCGEEASLIPDGTEWRHSELEDLLELLDPEVFLGNTLASGLATFLDNALAGRRLSPGSANVLLRKFRQAVVRESRLASEEALTRVWKPLPQHSVVSVPASAGERYVLRALAAAEGNVASLREAWLAPGAAIERLEVSDSLSLLGALQAPMEVETQADAAGAAALTIVKLAVSGSRMALEDQDFTRLRCLRAFDGSESSKLVSLNDLIAASREKRLFKDNPKVRGLVKSLWNAAPGTGALYVSESAAQILDEMHDRFPIAEGANVEFAALVLKALDFGSNADRERLLASIYTPEPEARNGLRALVAGDIRAASADVDLIALRGTVSRLDELALRLLDDSDSEFLVDAGMAMNLTPKHRNALGISEWDEVTLGRLLANNADRLQELDLVEETITELLTSAVPDADIRRLPVFTDTKGVLRRPTELWRVSPEWPVPHSLEHLVPQLRPFANSSAQSRAESLVGQWSPEAQARWALQQADAFNYAEEILEAVDRVPDIANIDWGQSSWVVDVRGAHWKSRDVIHLPTSVEHALRACLSENELQVVPITEVAASIRGHPGFNRLIETGKIPKGALAIDRLLEELRAVRPVAYMGTAEGESLDAFIQLSRAGTTLDLPAWQLLSSLLQLPGRNPDLVASAFQSIRHGQTNEAAQYLNSLANQAQASNHHAWIVYKSAFQELCKWPVQARQEALGITQVRTEAGDFRLGSEVAGYGHGLAPSHRLAEELRQFLPSEPGAKPEEEVSEAGNQLQSTHSPDATVLETEALEGLRPVLKYAAPHVPQGLLALVIGLIGRTPRFLDLALDGLNEMSDIDIRKVWLQLEDIVEAKFLPNSAPSVAARRSANLIALRAAESNPGTVEVKTLAGNTRPLPTGNLIPLELLGDLHNSGLNYWVDGHLVRKVTVGIALPEDVVVNAEHVKELCLLLAEVIIGHPHEQQPCFDALDQLADDFARPDQTMVESVQEEIRDQLPRVLRELRPGAGGALSTALERYQSTVDALLPGSTAGHARQRAKRALWNEVDSPHAHSELLTLIRTKLTNYGYDPNRILFEIFQNADDAYVQHPINGDGRFRLARSETGYLRIMHWGRLINHLGSDPVVGRQNGWHRDLFNMLQLNLSEKRANETGRFGLGFKSVHLISQDVGVASRFVASRVRGGMLPEVWEEGRRLSTDNTYAGRAATVVELVADPERVPEAEAMVRAFMAAVKWLPAMSSAIRTIEIAGRGAWKAQFSCTPFNGVRVVSLSGSSTGKALALKLENRTSLLLELDSDGPTAVDGGVARLWQLAPLEEAVKSGWLMNSSTFRVDPGRGQLAGTAEDKRSWFSAAGASLGNRLVELYDWVTEGWSEAAKALSLVDSSETTGRELFLERLFDLLASDLSDDLAQHLHSTQHGIGRLISERAALPTGLPLPFARFLAAGDVRYTLHGSLGNPEMLVGLSDWQSFDSIGTTSVSERIASHLGGLGFKKPPPFGLEQLLQEELGSDFRIDPALASRIGRLVAGRQFKTFTPSEQDGIRELLRQSKFLMEDGNWRGAALPPRDAAVSAHDELASILGFAPQSAVGAAEYVGTALELYELAIEQSGYQRTARTFSEWAYTTTDLERQRALLRYVAEGSQGAELAQHFEKNPVQWIPDSSDDIRESPLVEGLPEFALATLLSRLYPQEHVRRWSSNLWSESPSEAPVEVHRTDFGAWLLDLVAWWEKNALEERARHDASAYPEAFSWSRLRDCDAEGDREVWFTFFALGVFRTIGRTVDAAHRNFIDDATRSGWWAEMANAELPADPQPWIDRLEDIAGPNTLRVDYPQWRRAFADLYVVARWLPDYSDIFRNLPRLALQQGNFQLSDALRPSTSPLWQRRGLEGAPLAQSLGFGANWMIREAVRHAFWSPDEAAAMSRYAWAANSRVRRLLETFGITLSTEGHQMDLSPEVYEIVRYHLGDKASILGDLDLPLQLRAGDPL